MAVHTGVKVELKRQERNICYLTLETIAALINADKFIDAMIILESYCQHRSGHNPFETYDECKHYLSGFVDFVEAMSATTS
jgi:hypothetical protein